MNIHWKDWCWSWNSNTLVTWCKELTHWKRPWCWERLKAGGERDDRGWDDWKASLTWWIWVWASSRSWWWTGKPGMLGSMGLQRVRHDWATEGFIACRITVHLRFLFSTCRVKSAIFQWKFIFKKTVKKTFSFGIWGKLLWRNKFQGWDMTPYS